MVLGVVFWVDGQEWIDGEVVFGLVMEVVVGVYFMLCCWLMIDVYFGLGFSDGEIEVLLCWVKLFYSWFVDVVVEIVGLLVDNCIIGWFQGCMEFGLWVLGVCFILVLFIDLVMQVWMNEFKDCEDFCLVVLVILQVELVCWFLLVEVNGGVLFFMFFIYDVLLGQGECIFVVCYVDGMVCVQIVYFDSNLCFYVLFEDFGKIIGVLVLINILFNVCGELIVCMLCDVIVVFFSMLLDVLVIGLFFVEKN